MGWGSIVKHWVGVLSKIGILASWASIPIFLLGLKACRLRFATYSNIFVGSQSVSIEVRIIWYQSTGSKISFLSILSFVSCYYQKKKKKWNKKVMVIIENIVEDSIEVKYEDDSTTHNPQVSVNLLKMTLYNMLIFLE